MQKNFSQFTFFLLQAENHPLLANQNIAFTPEFKGDNNQSVTLLVSGTVLQNAIRYIADRRSTASSLRIAFIVYKDNTLFPSNETTLNVRRNYRKHHFFIG